MFITAVQPSVLSLFSSTGTAPLHLFQTRLDPSLPADSSIHLLHDGKSLPHPPTPALLISPPSLAHRADSDVDNAGYTLNQTVLQIQSPTLRTTYIQCPPDPAGPTMSLSYPGTTTPLKSNDLAIKHPWIHIQVRNMGREWSFELGLVDQSGRMGILRLSTFQKQPRLSTAPNSSPLLHLPLAFPPSSSRPLTTWSTVTLCLPSYLPYFSSSSSSSSSRLLIVQEDDPGDEPDSTVRSGRSNIATPSLIPSGRYSHVAYVRIYATCRLRRIWFDEGGPHQKIPWEFELYGEEE